MGKCFAPGDRCVDGVADRATDMRGTVNRHLIDMTTAARLGVGEEFLFQGAVASSLKAVWAHLSPQVQHPLM